jgi:diguanylate cyclase (GGDEF)-like protein
MGIPQAELTPRVHAALDALMAEVHGLRGELENARKRIAYLEDLADRDSLAPVLNRRAFVRELARMISFAERYGAPGSVLYFDIDGMKGINDRHGHAAGDAVLKRAAEALLGHLRGSDLVGRLGGDEFGVILARADADAAAAKAAALARSIRSDPVEWNGTTLRVGVSYGAYAFAGGEGVDEALDAADRAMYMHKRGATASPAKTA